MPSASTPLVVVEFFTAGGALPSPRPVPRERTPGRSRGADGRRASMTGEGRALLEGLLGDLAALEGVRPVAVVEAGAADALPRGVTAAPAGRTTPLRSAIRAAGRHSGSWLWPVVPETRGRLAGGVRAAEEAGVPVVGPPSAAVRRSARRRALLERLEDAGLAVPPTRRAGTAADARRAARSLGWPAVVKPGRGAGGDGTTRVETPADVASAWRRSAAVEPALDPLVQGWVEGEAASAVLLCGSGAVRPLAFSRQHVSFGPDARYRGGRTPFRHPEAGAALRAAVRAARVVGGLRGLVGVDLVLSGGTPVVVEVNPRLTTSYLGLRRHAGPAAAAAALRASGCPAPRPPGRPGPLPLGAGDEGPEPVTFGPSAGG